MILRLDPTRPIVWRSPFSMQIGIDPVAVILDDVDDGDARLIATLSSGATRAALDRTADAANVSRERVDALLRQLMPALLPVERETPPAQAPRIAVRGAVEGAARIARVLAEAGCAVVDRPASSGSRAARPDAAVLVSHHVADPLEHLAWLRRDLVHLPVVFGERAVTIGPVVDPGETPCLACLEQQRADADPAWLAIGSQLWGRPAAMDTPLAATLAALEVLTVLRPIPGGPGAGGRGPSGTSIRLDLVDDTRGEIQWTASERCGCRGLELTALGSGSP